MWRIPVGHGFQAATYLEVEWQQDVENILANRFQVAL